MHGREKWALATAILGVVTAAGSASQSAQLQVDLATTTPRTIAEAQCSADRIGGTIPVTAIGEPVSAITLDAPVWSAATQTGPAFCSVTGALAPADKSPTAQPINFRVVLPASWSRRAVQLGGGGINGVDPQPHRRPSTRSMVRAKYRHLRQRFGPSRRASAGLGAERRSHPRISATCR